MDRTEVKSIQADLNNLLEEFAKEHGLALVKNNVRYGDNELRFSLDFVKAGSAADAAANGGASERERNDYNLYANMLYGIVHKLDDVVMIGGQKLRIAGLHARRPKKSIILIGVDNGKRYVATPDSIKHHARLV